MNDAWIGTVGRRLRALSITAAATGILSGCAYMDDHIKKGLDQARELAERCEALDRESPSFSFETLLGRIKSRLTLSCNDAGSNCPFGLEDQLDKLQAELERSKLPQEELRRKFIDLRSRLKELEAATQQFIDKVQDDTSPASLRSQWVAVSQNCRVVAKDNGACNRGIATLVRQLQAQMRDVGNAAGKVQSKFEAVTVSWEGILADVGEINSSLPTTKQRLALEVNNVLESARYSMQTIADASVDEFRKAFFDRLLPTYTAERVLDFAERQFEPLDRLADKADDKFYMLGSAAIEWNRESIQEAFNSFYRQYLRKAFGSTESARAFARAACVRLSKPTATGRAGSIITPFLYSSMTLIENEIQFRETNGAVALKTGALMPTPSPSFDDPEVFNQCLAAERRVHRELGISGLKSNSDAVRLGSQKACTEGLILDEQRGTKASIANIDHQVAKLSIHTMSTSAQSPPQQAPAVAPASARTPPSFCAKFGQNSAGLNCVENADSAWIELNQSFTTGKHSEPKLVPTLRQLGRLVEAQPRGTRMEITGLASSAPMTCPQVRATLATEPCAWKNLKTSCDDSRQASKADSTATSANNLLGLARACWAGDVIRRHAPSLAPDLIKVQGSSGYQSGDPSFDRTVSIRIEWNSNSAVSAVRP